MNLSIIPSSCRHSLVPELRIEYDIKNKEWITLRDATTTLYFFPKSEDPDGQGIIRLSKVSFKWLMRGNVTVELRVITGCSDVKVLNNELTPQGDSFEYTVPPNNHRSPRNEAPSVSVTVTLGNGDSFEFRSLNLQYVAVA